MSRRLGRDPDGVMQLERTGPFVPPITFPTIAEVVVTSALRRALEGSPLSGLSFQEVRIVTAVNVRWEEWDRTQRLPPELPPTGEPEDYVPVGGHDPACAEAIGRLWEIKAPTCGVGSSRMVAFRKYEYKIDVPRQHPDFFHASGLGQMLVSETARRWLLDASPDWVMFEPIQQN